MAVAIFGFSLSFHTMKTEVVMVMRMKLLASSVFIVKEGEGGLIIKQVGSMGCVKLLHFPFNYDSMGCV